MRGRGRVDVGNHAVGGVERDRRILQHEGAVEAQLAVGRGRSCRPASGWPACRRAARCPWRRRRPPGPWMRSSPVAAMARSKATGGGAAVGVLPLPLGISALEEMRVCAKVRLPPTSSGAPPARLSDTAPSTLPRISLGTSRPMFFSWVSTRKARLWPGSRRSPSCRAAAAVDRAAADVGVQRRQARRVAGEGELRGPVADARGQLRRDVGAARQTEPAAQLRVAGGAGDLHVAVDHAADLRVLGEELRELSEVDALAPAAAP